MWRVHLRKKLIWAWHPPEIICHKNVSALVHAFTWKGWRRWDIFWSSIYSSCCQICLHRVFLFKFVYKLYFKIWHKTFFFFFSDWIGNVCVVDLEKITTKTVLLLGEGQLSRRALSVPEAQDHFGSFICSPGLYSLFLSGRCSWHLLPTPAQVHYSNRPIMGASIQIAPWIRSAKFTSPEGVIRGPALINWKVLPVECPWTPANGIINITALILPLPAQPEGPQTKAGNVGSAGQRNDKWVPRLLWCNVL